MTGFIMSPAQEFQIDLTAIKLCKPLERIARTLGIPAAMAKIQFEFFLNVGARERIPRTPAEMGLPFLDHASIIKHRTDVAGEIIRIRIIRIDDVAHLG